MSLSVKDLVYRNRTYRRFDESVEIPYSVLEGLVDLGRMSPSGKNLQWLRYAIVHETEERAQVFDTLAWAAYLKDWEGPAAGERPTAYIVILEDTSYGTGHPLDAGISAQSIMLGAVEQGFGGCMVANIRRPALAELLSVPGHMRIVLVLALGRPVEEVCVEPMPADGSVKYWREGEAHHVPKRRLDEVLFRKDGGV